MVVSINGDTTSSLDCLVQNPRIQWMMTGGNPHDLETSICRWKITIPNKK